METIIGEYTGTTIGIHSPTNSVAHVVGGGSLGLI